MEEGGRIRKEFWVIYKNYTKKLSLTVLQILTSAVNRIMSDLEVRQILIKFWSFENSNSEFKRIIRSLKARSASMDELET